MKFAILTVAAFAVVPALFAVACADAPLGKPLVVNEPGSFQDQAAWLYQTADGRHSSGPTAKGTNENLVMPSPSPEPGGAVEGVIIGRHPFDTLGYPMHIALVEKLFAASYKVRIYASDSGQIWRYEYGDPVENESTITKSSRSNFKAWGPFHADAVPLAQAPEPEIQSAFDFAKGALKSISNLPDSQKELANYGVLFIDDGSTVWVEFGPRFGEGEAPHLGCQTQVGRDMVFGYNKKQSGSGESGKFLQCF
jgi:hypothetical protein